MRFLRNFKEEKYNCHKLGNSPHLKIQFLFEWNSLISVWRELYGYYVNACISCVSELVRYKGYFMHDIKGITCTLSWLKFRTRRGLHVPSYDVFSSTWCSNDRVLIGRYLSIYCRTVLLVRSSIEYTDCRLVARRRMMVFSSPPSLRACLLSTRESYHRRWSLHFSAHVKRSSRCWKAKQERRERKNKKWRRQVRRSYNLWQTEGIDGDSTDLWLALLFDGLFFPQTFTLPIRRTAECN